MSTHKVIRFGVIGAGRIGKIHAENLALRIPGATVVAIADPLITEAQATADKLQIAKVYGDCSAIMQDPDIDAVAICSSTDSHARLIVEAAKNGKHIFCEKPIAYDLSKVIDEALQKPWKNAGVTLQIGFNRRFDPNFRRSARAGRRKGRCRRPAYRCVSPAATPPRRRWSM
jgi:myo-inositol 2-dehydrogenase / D-chiro-inositol 1-dehydrogenase